MICFLFHAIKPNQPLLGVKLVNRKIRRPFKSELVDCEYSLFSGSDTDTGDKILLLNDKYI